MGGLRGLCPFYHSGTTFSKSKFMICWTTSSSGIGDDSYASRSSSMKAISLYEVPYFLPGEGGLTTGAHEVRRRNVPLAGVMGLATHELIVKLVPEAGSIKTIFMRLFNVFYAHISNCKGKMSQRGHIFLRRRVKGRGTLVLQRGLS